MISLVLDFCKNRRKTLLICLVFCSIRVLIRLRHLTRLNPVLPLLSRCSYAVKELLSQVRNFLTTPNLFTCSPNTLKGADLYAFSSLPQQPPNSGYSVQLLSEPTFTRLDEPSVPVPQDSPVNMSEGQTFTPPTQPQSSSEATFRLCPPVRATPSTIFKVFNGIV